MLILKLPSEDQYREVPGRYTATDTGVIGFDMDCETPSACRGARYLVKLLANF
jgi:hypothetical protein